MKQRRKCEILHERGLGLSRRCSAEQNGSVQSGRALLRLFLFPFPKSWSMYRNNSVFCPGTKIVGWEHSGSSRNLVISPVPRYWHRKGIQGSFPHLNYSRRCPALPLPFLARPFLVKAQLNPPVPQTLEKNQIKEFVQYRTWWNWSTQWKRSYIKSIKFLVCWCWGECHRTRAEEWKTQKSWIQVQPGNEPLP